MSLDATRWAWQQDLRPSHKLTLLSLADRAGSDNTIWPSYEQITADTGLDRKTVSHAIQQMIDLGIMADTGQRRGATKQVPVYLLVGVEHRHKQYQKRDDSEQYRKRNRSENGTVPKTDNNSTENGTVPKTVLLPAEPATPLASEPVAQNLNSTENGTRNLSTTKEPIVGALAPPATEILPPQKPPQKRITATRLPEDWVLPKSWGEWALSERAGWTPETVRHVAATYRDYWCAKPGSAGRKLDWLATWRNWVRNQADTGILAQASKQSAWAGAS